MELYCQRCKKKVELDSDQVQKVKCLVGFFNMGAIKQYCAQCGTLLDEQLQVK